MYVVRQDRNFVEVDQVLIGCDRYDFAKLRRVRLPNGACAEPRVPRDVHEDAKCSVRH